MEEIISKFTEEEKNKLRNLINVYEKSKDDKTKNTNSFLFLSSIFNNN